MDNFGHFSPELLQELEEKWKELQAVFAKVKRTVEDSGRGKSLFPHADRINYHLTIYNICTDSRMETDNEQPHHGAHYLYIKFNWTMKELLKDYLDKLMAETGKGEGFLNQIVKYWIFYSIILSGTSKIFEYVDRYYTKHHTKDCLRDCGIKAFTEDIFQPFKDRIIHEMLAIIKEDREREAPPNRKDVLKPAAQMLVELQLNKINAYESEFQKELESETRSFYEEQSSLWFSHENATAYLRLTETAFNDERQRITQHLNPDSLDKIDDVLIEVLLVTKQKQLLDMENTGMRALLRDEKMEDLDRMHRLFSKIKPKNNMPSKGLEALGEIVKEFCSEEGQAVVKKYNDQEEIDGKEYISELLSLHQKYTTLLKEVFKDGAVFKTAISSAFSVFVNTPLRTGLKTETKIAPELLALYCDDLMKKDATNYTQDDEKLDDVFTRIVDLFSFLQDKDQFIEYYRKHLSRRLLSNRKAHQDVERNFISKFKLRCGNSFTCKVEGMLHDHSLNDENIKLFKQFLSESKERPKLEFIPTILTTGSWPLLEIDKLKCPSDVTEMMRKYQEHYAMRTQYRVLKWSHANSSAVLTGTFEKTTHDLSCTAFQATVLMLFNEREILTLDEISFSTDLSTEEVDRVVSCLKKKHRILILKDKEVSVNHSFTDKTRKIILPVINKDKKIVAQVLQQVNDDRKHAIDACIVRLMKSRKVMEHQQLVSDAIQQLSQLFQPDPKIIKQRIEDLINREFLERDPAVQNTYKYMA